MSRSSRIVNWPPRCSRNSVKPAEQIAAFQFGRVDRQPQVQKHADDARPGTLRKNSCEIGISDIQSDTDRDCFAMPEIVIRKLLQFVGGPVAEIERPGRARLERIASADVLRDAIAHIDK